MRGSALCMPGRSTATSRRSGGRGAPLAPQGASRTPLPPLRPSRRSPWRASPRSSPPACCARPLPRSWLRSSRRRRKSWRAALGHHVVAATSTTATAAAAATSAGTPAPTNYCRCYYCRCDGCCCYCDRRCFYHCCCDYGSYCCYYDYCYYECYDDGDYDDDGDDDDYYYYYYRYYYYCSYNYYCSYYYYYYYYYLPLAGASGRTPSRTVLPWALARRARSVGEALPLLGRMGENRTDADAISHDAAIIACGAGGERAAALALLGGIGSDTITHSAAISACEKDGESGEGAGTSGGGWEHTQD